jgi:hypothetical protein
MRFKSLVILLCFLVISILLASWLVHNPSIYPTLPKEFWEWMLNLYDAQSQEDIADLEFLVPAVTIFLVLSMGYALIAKRKTRKS